jgi:hypothetical protein
MTRQYGAWGEKSVTLGRDVEYAANLLPKITDQWHGFGFVGNQLARAICKHG